MRQRFAKDVLLAIADGVFGVPGGSDQRSQCIAGGRRNHVYEYCRRFESKGNSRQLSACYKQRMQMKRLGNSDMNITPIGIGAWAMGGSGWAFAWGPQDDNDSIAAIDAALDRGINWIDTAAVYGLGHSEEVVGRALAG